MSWLWCSSFTADTLILSSIMTWVTMGSFQPDATNPGSLKHFSDAILCNDGVCFNSFCATMAAHDTDKWGLKSWSSVIITFSGSSTAWSDDAWPAGGSTERRQTALQTATCLSLLQWPSHRRLHNWCLSSAHSISNLITSPSNSTKLGFTELMEALVLLWWVDSRQLCRVTGVSQRGWRQWQGWDWERLWAKENSK